MRLDEVAQELYAAPPGEFVAARDERVRRAKEAGDRELASQLGKLRRPTQSAWLVNLLWWRRRELVEELLALGEEFRGQELTRDRLHELSARRRELLHRLQAEAQQLSADAGLQLTAERAREVESTLAAALADPEAAAQVRAGRLVNALSYSGLGPELQLVPGIGSTAGSVGAASVSSAAPTRADRTGATGAEAPAGPAEAGEAGAAGAQTAGAQAAAEARAAAERLVYQRTEAWEDAVRQRDDLARRRDELQLELRRAQQRLQRVEDELVQAAQTMQSCLDSLEQAKQALSQ